MAKLDKPTLTVSDIAKKHQSTVAAIKKQLAMGRKVEREHTSNAAAADEIARDHLGEKPDYYSKLKKAHLEEDEDPCWDGYQQYGMKMKGGRKVPNCVPKKKKKINEADAVDMDRVLAAFRKKETGSYDGDYASDAAKRTHGKMSASGAYQFINKTWRNTTKNLGVGTEYKRAVEAPKEVQDNVMRSSLQKNIDKYGLQGAVNVHYTGNPEGRLSHKAAAANRGQNSSTYYKDFEKNMADYDEYKKTKVASATPSTTSTATSTSKPPEPVERPTVTSTATQTQAPSKVTSAEMPGDSASDFVKKQLKVAEETTMNEERAIISEAIESIIDNRLADMKEQFLAALNEKAMMKLDERKQEIAESMFED